jgi:glycosyltransferase involved in cell wall biosynthesis
MRILIFSTDDHLYPAGGAENAMGEITKRMPDVTFDLISAKLRPHVSREEQVGNVHIYRIGFGIPKLDGILLALFGHRLALRLHRQQPYDAVWSIMASYGAFSAVRVVRRTSLPFLLTLQEGDPIDEILHRVRFVRRQFNEIFARAGTVQAISNFLKDWAVRMGSRGRLEVVPNGVDITAFTTPQSEDVRARTRASFGFPSDAFVLITSSRLEKKNGVGDIIEALPMLPESVCLVVCGGGSLHDSLVARVTTLGLTSRVKFLGMVPITELPPLLHSSDAFIRPSLSEGLGNAFLEAMAARLPTIGTPVGGIPDFLIENVTGFLCAPENPESIRDTVRKVMGLPREERDRIVQRGYTRVVETYNWDTIARTMRTLFTDLIHGSTRT